MTRQSILKNIMSYNILLVKKGGVVEISMFSKCHVPIHLSYWKTILKSSFSARVLKFSMFFDILETKFGKKTYFWPLLVTDTAAILDFVKYHFFTSKNAKALSFSVGMGQNSAFIMLYGCLLKLGSSFLYSHWFLKKSCFYLKNMSFRLSENSCFKKNCKKKK